MTTQQSHVPSTKPYLIRAIYEWSTAAGFRPFIVVLVDGNTLVPLEFVRNGEIVLNISAAATDKLELSNESIRFYARFGGVPKLVSIPVNNVSAIFAQETGQGMTFDVELLADSGSVPVKPKLVLLSESTPLKEETPEMESKDLCGDSLETFSEAFDYSAEVLVSSKSNLERSGEFSCSSTASEALSDSASEQSENVKEEEPDALASEQVHSSVERKFTRIK